MTLTMLALATLIPATPESSAGHRISVLLHDDPIEHVEEIRREAKGLSEAERLRLYLRHEDEAGVPFALNGLLGFGVGSLVQGDGLGGLVGFVGEGAGLLMVLTHFDSTESSTVATAGALLWVGTRIFSLIRPWLHAERHNAALRSGLRLEARPAPTLGLCTVPDRGGVQVPVVGLRGRW